MYIQYILHGAQTCKQKIHLPSPLSLSLSYTFSLSLSFFLSLPLSLYPPLLLYIIIFDKVYSLCTCIHNTYYMGTNM